MARQLRLRKAGLGPSTEATATYVERGPTMRSLIVAAEYLFECPSCFSGMWAHDRLANAN